MKITREGWVPGHTTLESVGKDAMKNIVESVLCHYQENAHCDCLAGDDCHIKQPFAKRVRVTVIVEKIK